MKHFIAILACLATAPAVATEVRVCDGPLRSTPLSDERDVQSALVQAFAVVNDGAEPTTLSGISFELKHGSKTNDARWLLDEDVAKAVKQGPAIYGLAAVFPSQFCNGVLLAGTKPAQSATLGPGEAVVFMHQPFVWRGKRDMLNISAVTTTGGEPSSATASLAIDGSLSRTKALFPVEGRSFVAVAASLHTPHRWAAIEEFALDIVMLGAGGGTHSGTGQKLTDYFAFGKPIRAVAAGTVVKASGAMVDNSAMLKRADENGETYLQRLLAAQEGLIMSGIEAVLGNHVVIDHGNGEYSVYAHLKQDSVKVAVGDRIEAGATIGALGSSGNSTEPHLHFQICDSAEMTKCRTLPINFDGIVLPLELAPRTIQSGDVVETVK